MLGMPVRVAKPERLTGMADVLRNPSYSTSVGLLRLGLQMDAVSMVQPTANGAVSPARVGSFLSGIFRRLLPGDEEN
jgi:cell division protein FtsA